MANLWACVPQMARKALCGYASYRPAQLHRSCIRASCRPTGFWVPAMHGWEIHTHALGVTPACAGSRRHAQGHSRMRGITHACMRQGTCRGSCTHARGAGGTERVCVHVRRQGSQAYAQGAHGITCACIGHTRVARAEGGSPRCIMGSCAHMCFFGPQQQKG